jgi:dihydrofolate reductase
LTRVNCEIDGDVYYPKIDLSSWKKVSTESFKHDSENEYDFSVETFVKN